MDILPAITNNLVVLVSVLLIVGGFVASLFMKQRKDVSAPPLEEAEEDNQWRVFKLVAPRSKRLRWMKGDGSGSSGKSYSEIAKGPDRPARSRPAGKVGLVNQSNRLFSDWKTDHIQSRSAGRKDAHKKKSQPARKPKPK